MFAPFAADMYHVWVPLAVENRVLTSLTPQRHALERLYLAADCALGGEALDAGGAEESGDAGHHLQGCADVFGLVEGAAVADDHLIGVDGAAGGGHFLHFVDRFLQA